VSTADQPPPPYYQQSPLPLRRSNAWKWILGILGVIVLLCGGTFVACTALVGTGVNDAAERDQARAAENKKSCEGKSYPDQQPDHDHCADASGKVTMDSVQVTATPLQQRQSDLCTNVTYVNSSDKTISFNVFDWKLQVPTGEVKDAFDSGSADNPLGSGDLVRGGTKDGTLCYAVPGGGQYILIYKPTFWSDDRGIWVNTV
jgi:hypothetical protein